ncbi:isochorismate synthase [Gynuella sp.]|uniref:isochorismate synthase n=1 Tax=Gynuella sp. TaxID=2969146 RepID=UPI003D1315F1
MTIQALSFLTLPSAQSLAHSIDRLCAELSARPFTANRLQRVSCDIPAIDLLELLSSVAIAERGYFAHRNQTAAVAGFGQALELKIDALHHGPSLLSRAEMIIADTDAVWMGGCSYNGETGTGQWQGFPAMRFLLPLLEIREDHDSFQLALNLFARDVQHWEEQLQAITLLSRSIAKAKIKVTRAATINRRRQSVDRQQWHQQVGEALQKIGAGEFHKVVLAREVALQFSSPPNIFQTLKRWRQQLPSSFAFAIENHGKVFWGCSPERLFKRHGQRLCTEAMAGTVRRGINHAEDFSLEQQLKTDDKLTREHAVVADVICESLLPLAESIDHSQKPGVYKLDRIQHRYQSLNAVLKADISTDQLYRHLHPTPAVCGHPRVQAQAFISACELTQRGWYSGCVGVIGAGQTEFAVAIRSALSDRNHLWLYSGVGIVDGSDADAEWQELEAKIESLLEALN